MDNLFTRILKSALIVGTLDISAALLQYYIKTGKNPLNVLRFIASAVFGKEAFLVEKKMVFWGLLFHFGVAYVFTLFFFLIFPKLQAVLKNNFLIALLYGPFMWATMQWLVLPLTRAPELTVTLSGAMMAIAILIVCIAIPLSLMASKYYFKRV